MYLRAEEKGLDTSLHAALLRKTEKEHAKLLTIIDDKIDIETRLVASVEQHLARLEGELTSKIGMHLDGPYEALFADIPDVAELRVFANLAHKYRSSPKRRYIVFIRVQC